MAGNTPWTTDSTDNGQVTREAIEYAQKALVDSLTVPVLTIKPIERLARLVLNRFGNNRRENKEKVSGNLLQNGLDQIGKDASPESNSGACAVRKGSKKVTESVGNRARGITRATRFSKTAKTAAKTTKAVKLASTAKKLPGLRQKIMIKKHQS